MTRTIFLTKMHFWLILKSQRYIQPPDSPLIDGPQMAYGNPLKMLPNGVKPLQYSLLQCFSKR